MEYAISQGYMLVLARSYWSRTARGGYKAAQADRRMVRMDMVCHRSGTRKSVGTGRFKPATHKTGCPVRIKIKCRKCDGFKWFIDPRMEMHNHDLNLEDMDSILSYRRWRRKWIEGKNRANRGSQLPTPALAPSPTHHSTRPQPAAEPTGP